jgi:carbon monoxide dehydrogenase subunit G
MPINIGGKVDVNAPQNQVWDMIFDVDLMKNVIGRGTVVEKTPPSYVKIRGEGKGGGNYTSGDVVLNLSEEAGHTVMAYSGTGNLNGPLASLGQRLVDTVGRQFIDQGARIFASEIETRVGAVPAGEVHVEPEPAYGFMFQALVTLAVLAAIVALVVFLVIQSWPR